VFGGCTANPLRNTTWAGYGGSLGGYYAGGWGGSAPRTLNFGENTVRINDRGFRLLYGHTKLPAILLYLSIKIIHSKVLLSAIHFK
jgi:hypothetical protein